MSNPLENVPLWRTALAPQGDGLDMPREMLRQSFLSFRGRVADLVATLGSELPGLTVHDITHLDALWRIAQEIAGSEYPLNPAEAYVLGGAFLLHDAAHVLAAYPGRLSEIKQSVHWQDFVAQRSQGLEPVAGSEAEKSAIFQVLRHLHAEQAQRLPGIYWQVDAQGDRFYLIENQALREYYSDSIGEIAASHHWSPDKVAATFAGRRVSCPSFLAPAAWEVDSLKIALLLRTADAAHMDAARAPWFLFALRKPQGISADHWRFQAKMGQATRTAAGELRLASGASFAPNERAAWWLALDTARMVDRELRSANAILREENRTLFAAGNVLGVESADAFARHVPVRGWEPVDVSPRIGDATRLIASLGGAALYGESYAAPLRELLQNGLDAVAALRALNGVGPREGEIHVNVRAAEPGMWWLDVTDTGIGMSRHVLTNVLLDFGASLWASDTMRQELPGLAKAGFKPVGKFGIGFFSIFMLGDEVRVTTRRFEPANGESMVNWQLRFDEGLASRPALVRPDRDETLARSGTRVSVKLPNAKLTALVNANNKNGPFDALFQVTAESPKDLEGRRGIQLAWLVASLCPTSTIRITTCLDDQQTYIAINADDWKKIDDKELLGRVNCAGGAVYALNDGSGELIGRLGMKGASLQLHPTPASLVYEGVVCGHLDGLTGVACARENNNDARRAKAKPAGSLDDWKLWAERVVAGTTPLDMDHRLHLHPLLPEKDFDVWIVGAEELPLARVMELVKTKDEVSLHDGTVSHDSSDDMGSDRFNHSFAPKKDVICYPSFAPRDSWWPLSEAYLNSGEAFPWFLGVPPIDYQARFETALIATWGAFEKEDSKDVPVGEVDGSEIIRWVTQYRRAKD
ncbi:High temperature protein G [Variovorax sp. SRS16]|uniref:HD domain-containing protein n=1 Tax=Variovorax sp. SRS16 TaxID=282217 RepID=UPI001318F6B7|nr:ATP-binding protein [Variovorax sp. SRS16]VTU24964.1 High temperature protein G [Variovorax sp. SRS16]